MRYLGIDVYSYGRDGFVSKPLPLDHELTNDAFEKAVELVSVVDVLILDEVLNAVSFGLIQKERVVDFIESRGNAELILTGREFPEEIRALSGQVTRVVSEEHPFTNGVPTRKGFEY